MKKDIVKHLRDIADTMPCVFIPHDDTVEWRGKDLLLTPLADQVDDPDAMYKIYCPRLVAVEHYQQVKDAYKRGGWDAVMEYQIKVLVHCGFSPDEVGKLFAEKKRELYN